MNIAPTILLLLIARFFYFTGGEHTDLSAMLRAEPIDRYRNGDDEVVEWRFVEILATEWQPRFNSGEETIGFITGKPAPTLKRIKSHDKI